MTKTYSCRCNIEAYITAGDSIPPEDPRDKDELLKDKTVKWFDNIACTGHTIDQSFLQKDLELLTVNGTAFSDYVKRMNLGKIIKVTYTHVEATVQYEVYFKVVKTRGASENKPMILNFIEVGTLKQGI